MTWFVIGAFCYFVLALGFTLGYAIRSDRVGSAVVLAVAWPIHMLMTFGISLGEWVFDKRIEGGGGAQGGHQP